MNKFKKVISYACPIAIVLVLSACGSNNNAGAPIDQNVTPVQENKDVQEPQLKDSILMIVDQSLEEPNPANHFYFQVKQLPEGYSLDKMQWKSDKTTIITTIQQAFENGASGGEGFYISGDGQFSGFFYNPKMKGEKGGVTFYFKNEEENQLEWKKELTLK
ncbi:hypothetical protein JNUCC42_20005 [Brevibacterium sp. JNUCC-42]|nr:hypothetical protein JNUCC42_20005 [Brevibacterium sp. JNUCC-42]